MRINLLVLLLLTGSAIAEEMIQQQQQQQQYIAPPPIQQQLTLELSDRCKAKLEYYKKMVDIYKDSNSLTKGYFQYQLNKWQHRCLD